MDADPRPEGFLRYVRRRRRAWLLVAAATFLGVGVSLLFGAGRFVLPVVFGE